MQVDVERALVADAHGRHGQRAVSAAAALDKGFVDPAQHLRQRPAVADQHPDDVADQPGHRRGLDALAGDVADHHQPAPVRHGDHVVEVAAHVGIAQRRHILRAEGDPADRGQRRRQQRLLQRLRDPPPFGVDARVVQRERGPARHVLDDRDLLRLLPVVAVAPHRQRTEPLAARGQWQREAVHRRRQRRLPAGADGVPQPGRRSGRGQLGEQVGQGRLVAVRGRGELRLAPLVRGVDRTPLAEPRHDQPGDQGHGEVDLQGLGEQLARLRQEGQPRLAAQVGAAQPVVLQGQAQPLRGQLGERPHVAAGTGRHGQRELAAPGPGDGQRDPHLAAVARDPQAVLGQRHPPVAVAAVQQHHPGGGAQRPAQAAEQLADG
jgi:hypothetical protein